MTRVRSVFLRLVFSTCVVLTTLRADSGKPLAGRVTETHYISPTGFYRVELPANPEQRGTIADTPNVVTFHNDVDLHQSIACFPMNATQRWEEATRGRKDYLVWFFSSFVQPDFENRFPGAKVESAHFLPGVQDGALLTYTLLPGGTMFAAQLKTADGEKPPVAKRGNLLFVKNEHVFVLSLESAAHVLNRAADAMPTAEEDALLRRQLIALLSRMSFAVPTTASAPARTSSETAPSAP